MTQQPFSERTSVLVVIPGDGMRRLTVGALRENGFEPIEAATEAGAVRMIGEHRGFAAAIIERAAVDGDLEFFHRSLEDGQRTPVLLVLASETEANVPRTNGSTWLGQPADPHQVAYTLANLLSRGT